MKTLVLISKLTRDERGGAGESHVELGGERGQKHRRHSKVLAATTQQNPELDFLSVVDLDSVGLASFRRIRIGVNFNQI
jgi:hypothetical protein